MIFERGHFSNDILEKSVVTEILNESRNFSKTTFDSYTKSVFLSHKHYDEKDKEWKDLRGVIKMLKDLGAKPYIDSMDNTMPGETSAETALRIKQEIKSCDKFIFFATKEAIQSYWCNWELGISDSTKKGDEIALLPLKDKGTADENFIGNEYMRIYRTIEFRDGTTKYSDGNPIKRGYYVCTPKQSTKNKIITALKDWLNR